MAILDYPEKVTVYLQQHFAPSDPDRANFRRSTSELLNFLFTIFPTNCVNDYELIEILTDLGYSPQQWVNETFTSEGSGEDKVVTVHRSLATGWCLKTEFDLRDDEYQGI